MKKDLLIGVFVAAFAVWMGVTVQSAQAQTATPTPTPTPTATPAAAPNTGFGYFSK